MSKEPSPGSGSSSWDGYDEPAGAAGWLLLLGRMQPFLELLGLGRLGLEGYSMT